MECLRERGFELQLLLVILDLLRMPFFMHPVARAEGVARSIPIESQAGANVVCFLVKVCKTKQR